MGLINVLSSVFSKSQLERYVVIDFETTGLKPVQDEIIEMAAIRVVNGRITETFSQLVKPSHVVSSKIADITNITNNMLAGAPSINRVLPQFLGFIGSDVLVGHNIENFDSQFLAIACLRFRFALNNQIVDTLPLAQIAVPKLKNHKLETLCEHFKIKNQNAHRALSDCEATYKVFEKLSRTEQIVVTDIPAPKNVRKYPESSNDTTKKLQKLDDTLFNALLDGTISADEVKKIKSWIRRNADLSEQYPIPQLSKVIAEKSDPVELFLAIRDVCLPNYDIMNANQPIFLNGKSVVVTGEFCFGSNEELIAELSRRGANVKKNVSSKVDYLVVGKYGSIDWAFHGYGNQIKYAMELIEKGKEILIVSEDTFWRNAR